ncbi:MAG TPA: NAD(P)/FAD-dependent oxidoreductase [Fimbriimonadaceae bacterium]|nr:NAD(P)/FAD-dependent oxidoreductase [Fimbriimonadaceae bacterium]
MKVGVVGLGAAGLRTAMLLKAAGIEYELFEARQRPGGRLHTVDAGFGAIFEGGGEWIDSDHRRVLDLLREFGHEPVQNQEWPGKVVYSGKHTTEALLWNDALEDELRVEAAARDHCRDLYEPAWSNTRHVELDSKNVSSFLANHTTTDRGRWWVNVNVRSDEGDDLSRIGLLGWLSGYLKYMDRDGDVASAYRIPGGAKTLYEGMAAAADSEAHYGYVLRRVRQDAGGVTLTFNMGEARFDRVILTLPPPCLEQVVFEPALSVYKRCAVEACEMSRAIKLSWEFETPWWKDQGWGGSMKCEGPIQQTWDASFGEAHILTAYVCGQAALEWLGLEDPVRAGVHELSMIIPEAVQTYKRGWMQDWVNDPYARGAFSHLAPGYVLEHMEHISTPEGLIHFAGEHCASWIGFIEGALESAENVVREVLQA